MHELQCLISADGPAFERNANRIDFVLQDSRAQTGASHLGQQIVVKTRPAFRLRARHFCRINIKQVAISIAEVLARRTLQSVAGFSFESLASGQISVYVLRCRLVALLRHDLAVYDVEVVRQGEDRRVPETIHQPAGEFMVAIWLSPVLIVELAHQTFEFFVAVGVYYFDDLSVA